MEGDEFKFDHDPDKTEDQYLKDLGQLYKESALAYDDPKDKFIELELDYLIEKNEAGLKEFYGYKDDPEIYERVRNFGITNWEDKLQPQKDDPDIELDKD